MEKFNFFAILAGIFIGSAVGIITGSTIGGAFICFGISFFLLALKELKN